MKIIRKTKNNNNPELYDNYLALDWSKDNATMARMKSQSGTPQISVLGSNVKEVKEYLKIVPGKSIMTIEETTTTHWLYVELKDTVNKIVICNPYRNKLLGEGAKTDKIDAAKLCLLLRSGLIKEVYHSMDEDYKIRKLVSAYEDLVKAGVRIKNQKAALYLAEGLDYKKDKLTKNCSITNFIDESQNHYIELYKTEKKQYETLFNSIIKKNITLKNLCKISGIGPITALTIYSKVVDANRFENKYKYWCYCGLVQNGKWSGGKYYGKRNPMFSRRLKSCYKIAALAALTGNNDIREYYENMLREGIETYKARHEIARYIAKVTYAMMKHGTEYIPYSWRQEKN